jgi:hypothetical protein
MKRRPAYQRLYGTGLRRPSPIVYRTGLVSGIAAKACLLAQMLAHEQGRVADCGKAERMARRANSPARRKAADALHAGAEPPRCDLAPPSRVVPVKPMAALDRLDLTNMEIVQAARCHLSRAIGLLEMSTGAAGNVPPSPAVS